MMTKSVVRKKGCLLNIINYNPTSNLIRGIGAFIYIYTEGGGGRGLIQFLPCLMGWMEGQNNGLTDRWGEGRWGGGVEKEVGGGGIEGGGGD